MRLLIILFCSNFIFSDSYFPNETWEKKSASELGLSEEKVNLLIEKSFEDKATMGAVIIKDGYIVSEKYARGFNENSYGTSWSTAKSFYAALIGISLDKGEIKSLDEPVANYVDSYNSQSKKDITIREILNMTSGLEFPSHEHEMMFFEEDHLKYALELSLIHI